jgi:hypothetical protein
MFSNLLGRFYKGMLGDNKGMKVKNNQINKKRFGR